jgi:hypothetical protein
MASESILDTFNSTLLQFLDQLGKLFPNGNAKSYHNKLSIALSVNKTMWIKYFMDNAEHHGNEIMSKNENYFIKTDFNFADNLDLKNCYTSSNLQTKEIMWQYIQSLYLLACGYYSRHPIK